MGRKKIQIREIVDDRYRQVTFAKRKQGVFKKAYELSVLCRSEVGVIIFSENGKLAQYSTAGMDRLLSRYTHLHDDPAETRTNEDLRETFSTTSERLKQEAAINLQRIERFRFLTEEDLHLEERKKTNNSPQSIFSFDPIILEQIEGSPLETFLKKE